MWPTHRTPVLICAHNHFLSLIILVNKHCYPWRRLAAGVALTDLVSCVGSWREISCIYVLVRFWLFSVLQHTRLGTIVLSSYGRGMAIIPTINQYQLHSSERRYKGKMRKKDACLKKGSMFVKGDYSCVVNEFDVRVIILD